MILLVNAAVALDADFWTRFMPSSCRNTLRVLALVLVFSGCERAIAAPKIVDAEPPAVREDFSSYASTAEFLASAHGIYSPSEDFHTHRMVIDRSVSYRGSTQSLRYDYPDGDEQRGNYTVSREIEFENGTSEVWLRAVVRFSPDFTISSAEGGGNSFKFLHARWSSGRWQVQFEFDEIRFGPNLAAPSSSVARPSVSSLFDGEWHEFQWHIRTDGRGRPGLMELWIDGAYQGRSRSFTSQTDAFRGLSLSRNHNQLPDRPIRMWWGLVEVYYSDPGW